MFLGYTGELQPDEPPIWPKAHYGTSIGVQSPKFKKGGPFGVVTP